MAAAAALAPAAASAFLSSPGAVRERSCVLPRVGPRAGAGGKNAQQYDLTPGALRWRAQRRGCSPTAHRRGASTHRCTGRAALLGEGPSGRRAHASLCGECVRSSAQQQRAVSGARDSRASARTHLTPRAGMRRTQGAAGARRSCHGYERGGHGVEYSFRPRTANAACQTRTGVYQMEGSPALAVADGGRIAAGLRKLAQDGLGLAHHRDAALRALHDDNAALEKLQRGTITALMWK